MDLREVIEFANKNQVCYVATSEGDQPRVRGFLMWFADETGFYFHTGVPKRIYRQLVNNPKVEVCFFTQGAAERAERMLRVTGKVKFVDDPGLKKRLVEERPFLKAIVSGDDDPNLVIFRIYSGEARFWTMENNMRENEVEVVHF
ncbi:pyridoxamine 5'-phosphate oxidase family protein [Pelotomaculum sp. PtaB.Bin117]|uniref:pyridoxamine 5'-phosphate oxidase family protein n=1 Tax=Pelotomaculum sp. PtaB.Bin117 TaxID=1811694 RepID=UPI0009D2391A|nr:pyridoxamine 5'-phosphate oxidase family protein [Pelotomaculum sp. PtaB.Bin117]OPX90402.1 MAG: Pyridoxamine 5'-phosphate oxidase [Pelotomaculum sp. PtaB.Bin117]OPY59255.1 MAG: Pyridoxamine 5'-phosphate oxidase [Pelotomaculum sp. PtaU1.Bin065]